MNPSIDHVPFARPSLGTEEEEAVLRVMRSGWLTTGAETLAFEKEFAAFTGAAHALAVNSATSGLHLALEAAGVGNGDTVITSPYTFTSTAAVIRHLGAEVVFCDTAPDSYNMDPVALERVLASAKNCKAVIPVHIGGLPCDMVSIVALAHTYGCLVIEDAAHAFPVRTKEGFIGTVGDIGVYSFYATKTITTGEGGMIVTGSSRLAGRMGRMRMHGIDREVWDRYTSKKAAWRYGVLEAGYKYNMPDILSAIGRVQLTKADAFLDQRRSMASGYDKAFAGIDGLKLPPRSADEPSAHAWHLYAIRVSQKGQLDHRDRFIESLAERGVGASVHFIPLHTMRYYADRYKLTDESFPCALSMFAQSVSLPIWQGMGDGDAQKVIQAVLDTSRSLASDKAR